MNVLVKLHNDNTTAIPNVHWHPESGYRLNAGCYVMESSLKKYNNKYNIEHAKMFPDNHVDRTVDEFINSIECAEMPFEIIQDSDSPTPWKCFGLTKKEVHYGMDDNFWKNEA